MRTRNKVLLGCLTTFIVLALAAYGWYRYEYPYGYTHCCTRGLWFDLRQYAEEHDGKFPAGEVTPEASLSLLYRSVHAPDFFLAGRAKSGRVAKKVLESGGLLGPDTCDWHYVEGLTWDDDSEIAIMWDKSSLGHTGQRLNGGHEVMRIGSPCEVIPAAKWEEFLAEQQKLMARRSQWAKEGRPILTAKVKMPDGSVVDHVDESVDLEYPQASIGGYQYASRLCWYYPHAENGKTSYRLSFGALRSEPLTVEWHNGLPDPAMIIFRMRPASEQYKRSLREHDK